jgi:hypothetical protein
MRDAREFRLCNMRVLKLEVKNSNLMFGGGLKVFHSHAQFWQRSFGSLISSISSFREQELFSISKVLVL